LIWFCVSFLALAPAFAQLPSAERPRAPFLYRSYKGASVDPIRLTNSDRLHTLMRAGVLYLTVQDAIALAIENNLGLEVDRYGLPTADWAMKRAEAGGPIRGLSQGAPNVGAVDQGVGVLGAISSAGVGVNSGGGAGFVGGGSGAIVQQIGPVVVNFDPSFTGSTTFSHLTYPQSNLAVSQTAALVDSNRVYNQQVREGLASGGSVLYQNYQYSQRENAPGDTLNPAVGPYMRVMYQQPLLQNYGVALNSRTIRVAHNSLVSARETFRGRLLGMVASVTNQYWSLVSAIEEQKVRERAVEINRKFVEDTKKQFAAGAVARYQLPRAEAELASRRQDLILAQVAVRQQEASLKEQLVRTEDPAVDLAQVVPLDSIEIPEQDDLPPLKELVTKAMTKRPDVQIAKIADENALINSIGTANGLLPVLIAYGVMSDRGAAGTPAPGQRVNQYFNGGYGTALGQIFRRNFPNEYGGLFLNGFPLHNRQAQADYGIEQLQLQAAQLTGQKANNDIAVNVSNQVIALRQARARYTTALNTRKLQEELLAAERLKFASGISTFSAIIIDQRAVVAAQISEVNAQAAYVRARVSLDQVLGETLERNNVSMEEGMSGRVSRESRIPDVTPAARASGSDPLVRGQALK
jgi:outer membrane protein TolC